MYVPFASFHGVCLLNRKKIFFQICRRTSVFEKLCSPSKEIILSAQRSISCEPQVYTVNEGAVIVL